MPDAMDGRSPAQLYALAVGFLLTFAGIAGFFYEARFEGGDDLPREALLGLVDVNGWHNLVHVLSGVFALLVASSAAAGRIFALVFGGVFLAGAVLGFLEGDGGVLLGSLPVSHEGNVLHFLVGVAGVGAGISTPAAPASAAVASPSRS